ncbi:MAG: primosomal protein N' [Thermostichales cyanobacterium HHBFW_bins_127]
MTWVDVWVDHPKLDGCFTYQVPDPLQVQLGDILTVPFGHQVLAAIAVRLLDHPPPDRDPATLRPIQAIAEPGILPPFFWPLLHWVSETYLTPLPQVIRTVLPPGLLQRRQRRLRFRDPQRLGECHPQAQALAARIRSKGDLSWRFLCQGDPEVEGWLGELLRKGVIESFWQDSPAPKPQTITMVSYRGGMGLEGLTPRQREVVGILQRQGGEMPLKELLGQAKTSRSLIQTLEEKGWLQTYVREVLRQPHLPAIPPSVPLTLSPAQQQALEQIRGLQPGQVLLLHGVTGSGKTEVYLQAIGECLHRGKAALVLVPEIGLTPQMVDRFRARFGERVWLYHSALSPAERYDTWRQILSGDPVVVVGTRSAIFLPLPHLGMIILDEEHDDSYKQDQPQPCYHARDVARYRARRDPCVLVLGTATPALETWYGAEQGGMGRASLPERIQQRPLPPVEVVDLRQELLRGNRSPFSQRLAQALEQLPPGEQAILFLPRRGYSTFVSCRACGSVLMCPHCDVSLTFHQVGQQLRCHYCGYRREAPRYCPACASPHLKDFGTGTQRIEAVLRERFPKLRPLRFDRDTTQRQGSHRQILTAFARGEADVLIGTQMLTKGLDIPQVTVVGILAADGLLHRADFRAGERTFQLLTQVAGRAGRGASPGRVILQTYSPEHPIIEAIQRYDYRAMAAAELQARQEAHYPPFCRLVLVRFSSRDPEILPSYGEKLLGYVADLGVSSLGPAPADVERVQGWYRWHWLLKWAGEDEQLSAVLWQRLRELPTFPGIRLSLDVDPYHIN